MFIYNLNLNITIKLHTAIIQTLLQILKNLLLPLNFRLQKKYIQINKREINGSCEVFNDVVFS